jgi:hypothetical protein
MSEVALEVLVVVVNNEVVGSEVFFWNFFPRFLNTNSVLLFLIRGF